MLRDATQRTLIGLAKRGNVLKDFNKSTNIAMLNDGKEIAFRSADNPDSLRGPNLDWFYIDEAAMCGHDAMLIMLGRLRGSGNIPRQNLRGWATTTPRGKNWVWQMFANGDPSEFALIRASTRTNTYLPADFIKSVEGSYSERWRAQELEGEFVDDNGSVFRGVRECATSAKLDKGGDGRTYIAGLDWGRSNDYTVLTVFDARDKREVFKDRFNQIDYTVQRNRIRAVHERFGITTIIAEANSMGQPNIEMLLRDGLPVQSFTTTNATKATIIEALALAFERREIGILNDDVCINELQAFEMERMTSGMMRYGAPSGMHDDTVMSMALAWYGVEGRATPSWVRFAKKQMESMDATKVNDMAEVA
jgi:phage terminase large subunit-like protein